MATELKKRKSSKANPMLSKRKTAAPNNRSIAAKSQKTAPPVGEDAQIDPRHLLDILLEGLPDAVYFKDLQSRFLLISHSLVKPFGLTNSAQAIGKTDFDFFTEEHARMAFEDEQRIIRTGHPILGIEEKETWPDGHETWVSTSKFPMRNENGEIVGTYGISRDITEKKKAEAADRAAAILLAEKTGLESTNIALQLEIAERRKIEAALAFEQGLLKTLMDNFPDTIYFKDTQSRFTRISKSQAAKLGLENPEDAIGKTDFDFFEESTAHLAFDAEQEIIRTGIPVINVEEKLTWPDRPPQWVTATKLPLRDAIGRIVGTFGVSRDITSLKQAEEMLRSLSHTDELTGLLNRRGFTILAEQQIKMAHRMSHNLVLLFIDVDGLKAINDKFGHSQGDLVIVETAAVLRETFREADILSRLGGDEFVVLTLETADGSAEPMLTRLQKTVDSHNQQPDRFYNVSISTGVANYDPKNPVPIEELIAVADGRMYQQKTAKKAGHV